MRTGPLGFVIFWVQVSKIAGYDEDVIFLVVPDESEFSRYVPLMIETYTLGRIVNVIKESDLDRLSTPWVMVWASCLLCRSGMVDWELENAGGSPAQGGATTPKASQGQEIVGPIPDPNHRVQNQAFALGKCSGNGDALEGWQGSARWGVASTPGPACFACIYLAKDE